MMSCLRNGENPNESRRHPEELARISSPHLRMTGHSFRVLAANGGSVTAGRPDLRLLSGDAFSVYNKHNTQTINIIKFYRTRKQYVAKVRLVLYSITIFRIL